MAWHFVTWRKASAALEKLEADAARLGIPTSPHKVRVFQLGAANKEIARLTGLVTAAMGVPPTPSPKSLAPVATIAAPRTSSLKPLPPTATPGISLRVAAKQAGGPSLPAPAPAKAIAISREALNEIAKLFPLLNASPDLADDELMASIERAAFEAFLSIRGMRPDAELAALYDREDAAVAVHGLRRVLRCMRQSRIDAIIQASAVGPAPRQTTLSAPQLSAGVASLPAAVIPCTAAGRPTRAQMLALADQVFPLATSGTRSLSDQALFEALEKAAYLAHVHLPGARADSAFDFPRPAKQGIVRIMAPALQAKINRIVNQK